jgi:hypothetical protein
MGGLGNQMFQYAAARRLAIKHDTDLVLDLSWFARQPRVDTPRQYELDPFPIVGRRTDEPVEGGRPRQILQAFMRASGPYRVVEQGPRFQPELLDAPDDTLLVGYWQSEKYFLDEEAQVRRDFAFEAPVSPRARTLAESIDGSAVSVHVRRGDYVSRIRTHEFHGLLPIEYYERAAAALSERVPKPHFLVFSDDPGWCRTNIKLPSTTTVVSHAESTPYEDMLLMSLCRHHIIANSSFSWWAAWLSTSPEKVVVGPRAWFADESRDTSDLVPQSWIRL